MRRVNIAITGFGSIGRRLASLLLARHERYRERHAVDVRISGVCGSSAGLLDAQGLSQRQLDNRERFTPGLTGRDFIDRVPADVLFEAGPSDFRTGGAALDYLRRALRRRIHAIALSKGALVVDAQGLMALARQQGVSLRISAATAAALPTIDLLQYNLAGCRVTQIEAILTGTTNLILSEMMDRDCTFEAALCQAQQLGIAEPDPSFDIDGWDTACKVAIIANTAFQAGIDVTTMARMGIRHINSGDVQAWRAQCLMPRLVGVINWVDGAVRAQVELRLFPRSHLLAQVHGRMKAIRIVTEEMGELTVMGGASDPLATAAAALKDFEHTLASLLD